MFKKFKDIKQMMDMVKDLEKNAKGLDMSDPKAMLETMGIDINEMESHYQNSVMETFKTDVDLSYTISEDGTDPSYAYPTDSGMDLYSSENIIINGLSRAIVSTGVHFNIPKNFEIQIRTKSGIALKQGLMVLNSPGTIDQGYTGEIKVIIFNTTKDNVEIKRGQKIAQAVLCPVVSGEMINLFKVSNIENKDRNDNGFGSTGI
jgi:dUTP pyrophosphatase